MSNTFTIRLPEELLKRLREKSRRTGLPLGRIVRTVLETTLAEESEREWMRHAGSMSGPRDFSSRKGYSRS